MNSFRRYFFCTFFSSSEEKLSIWYTQSGKKNYYDSFRFVADRAEHLQRLTIHTLSPLIWATINMHKQMTEYIYEVGHFVREYWFRAYNTESSRHDERNTYINASYQRKCSDDDGRRQVMCFNNNLTALQTSTQTDSFARGLDFASVEYIRRNIKYSTAYALYKGRWRNQSFFGFRFESRRKRTEAKFFFFG